MAATRRATWSHWYRSDDWRGGRGLSGRGERRRVLRGEAGSALLGVVDCQRDADAHTYGLGREGTREPPAGRGRGTGT